MAYMDPKATTLGGELRRLRTSAGATLRGLARTVDVSAPHLSDIERDRRRPSKALLAKLVSELESAGATVAGLDRLDARFERDLQEWAAATPEVRRLLRQIKESGRPVSDVLKDLERQLQGSSRPK
jgi:transcriptional regulator with XRE-family HTH domain